jgi:hypothetical protein
VKLFPTVDDALDAVTRNESERGFAALGNSTLHTLCGKTDRRFFWTG